ncbi:MAG: hypothetical protein WDN26_06060 [Chitinophagaceae bacterium]
MKCFWGKYFDNPSISKALRSPDYFNYWYRNKLTKRPKRLMKEVLLFARL